MTVAVEPERDTDHFSREMRLLDGPIRWLYGAVGLIAIWAYRQNGLTGGAVAGISLYFGLNIAWVVLQPRIDGRWRRLGITGLLVTDLLFASFLTYYTGGLVSQFFLLYGLLTFKAAIYYPYIHAIIYVPFSIFPLYVITLYLATGTLVFSIDQLFISRYLLLLAVIFAAMYTAWHLDSRHRQTRGLLQQLEIEHRQTDTRRRELRAVLDSIGDGVIVVDRALNLLMVNPVAAQMFNLSDSAPGVSLPGVIQNPRLLELLRHTLENSTNPGIPILEEFETRLPSTRNPAIFQALATALVGSDGTTHGAVIVLRDMTRQKELEESKNNFISVLSHELRTPLTAIRGFLDLLLLETEGWTEKQREYVDIAFDQTNQLQQLINALLEFAEMETATTTLNPSYVRPDHLVFDAVEQIQPLADQRAITLEVQASPDPPPILADGQRLEQVLLNLLDNAVKFTPRHGQVTVSVIQQPAETLFVVRDTGIGVSEKERERIFERFYQVDSSSTREYGGTGLGLALCRHIVEMHRGRIWVEPGDDDTSPSQAPGSRFCFTIPRESARYFDQDDGQVSALSSSP
jgi:two-component system phosphate regulon sensor histidine kinase PhoR